MLLYEYFYRQFGVRRSSQLIKPPLPGVDKLVLPRRSLFHFLGDGPMASGPDTHQLEFNGITKPILVETILSQSGTLGQPRPIPMATTTLMSQWFQKNRRYRKLINFETGTRDETMLVVINYAFLWRMYRYPRSLYTNLNQWHNVAETLWSTVGSLSDSSDRHQFIPVTLPRVLPSLVDLQTAETAMLSARTAKRFATHESLQLLEIWKWLGPNRQTSMLSHIPEKRLARVNLLMEEAGRWFVVNLNVLNSWRIATKEELDANPDANQHGLDPHMLQKYFLRMCMSLMEVRTAAAPEISAASQEGVDSDVKVDLVANVVDEHDPETGIAVKSVTEPFLDPVAHLKATQQVDAEVQDVADMHLELLTNQQKAKATAKVIELKENAPDERGVDIKRDLALEKQLEADLQQLEHIANLAMPEVDEAAPIEHQAPIDPPVALTPEGAVMKICDRLAEQGLLSAGEHRRYKSLSEAYKKIVAPDGNSTLEHFVHIPKEDVQIAESATIPDIKTVTDKTMLKSSLIDFDAKYIQKVMQKDIAAMVLNLQQAGLCITDYEVEDIDDVMGQYKMYTARVTPVDGATSTFRFRLPVVREDGTFTSNGVKYRVRKQRGDLPIRKIGPDKVALTSYYGKVFVNRSTKKVNDYPSWLINNIQAMGLDRENTIVTDLHTADVFDNLFEAPRLYSLLSMAFRSFTLYGYVWNFDHTKRKELFGENALKLYEKDQRTLVAVKADDPNTYMVMDHLDTLYSVTTDQGKELVALPSIEEMLKLPAEKAPVEFAQVKILGRDVPLGVVLGYELGLDKLMRMLKVTPRRVPAGQRVGLQPDEYDLVFADETLVFPRHNRFASMVMAGFNEYHRQLRSYPVHEFDKRGVYLNLLESAGASQRYLREIDLQYQLFIDPITKELLIDMKEPTDYQSLLLKACSMLLTDTHPDELDSKWMRIKGYERMAGAVYSEIVRSIRIHNGKVGKSRSPIDLNPFQVWKNVTQDPAKVQINEINPIQNLKEGEAVTYSGVGGRGGRSMTKSTRVYHKNDMGTISESTVDSSDVAINTYLSADPQFSSLRGLSKGYSFEKQGATPLLSTSALISPAADRDDPKRVNFIGIQQSHGIACKGYTQAPIRTGYEQVIAHRTGDLFALTAKKPGKVLSVNEHGMQVQYEDGELQGIELGRRYGSAAGLTIPHEVKTTMKAGQVFKPGQLLCFNDGFFERDLLNPDGVILKNSITVKTALLEAMNTLEDSSAISKEAAELLTTKTTKVRTIVVNFEQEIHKLTKTGTPVGSEDILCVIEDAVTAGNRLFDEASLDTLRLLSAQTPKAKAKGVVERIEVFYHGDLEDMSESLRALAQDSDKLMLKRTRSTGGKGYTGSVDESYRVDGEPLLLDTAAIKIYITAEVSAGVGDKGVFGNQLKTVFGEIMEHDLLTESGTKVDALFGAVSIQARIVSSPDIIGTTTTLLEVIAKKALEIYRS
jgi:hypothetical protein